MKFSILLFVASLALFTIGLSGQEIISFDARFYLFALEMWRNGISWFPTTYGAPYPDYPALSTILVVGSASLFGGLNKFTAVLPSATAAALTVVVTYHIGRLQDKRLGFYAVFMLIGTLAFFKSARAIALDMYPTLITACCFYLVHSATINHQPRRVRWVYPLLALSFVFRGPIGLVMPTGVVCVYYLLAGRFKQFFVVGVKAFVLLLLCVAGLLWLAYQVGGSVFLQEVWRMEVMGRMGEQFLPLSFYFTDSLLSYALAYPFALMAMLVAVCHYFARAERTEASRFLLQLTGWVLVIMLGMSIPGDKKVRYVLPMAPALALLAASVWLNISKDKFSVFLRKLMTCFFLLLPGLFAVATAYAWHISVRYGLSDELPFLSLIIFFVVVQVGGVYGYFTKDDSAAERLTWVIFSGVLCFVVANLFVIEPVELYVDRTRDFVQGIERLRLEKDAQLVFYRERSDGLPIKYLVNVGDAVQPLFMTNEAQLRQVRKPAVMITSIDYFEDLLTHSTQRYRVIGKGRVGHVEVVVFEHDR